MRASRLGRLLSSGLLACCAFPQDSGKVAAKVAEPDNWCREGTFIHEPDFQVAEVIRATQFLRDDGACPAVENAACRKPGELAAGSEVLVAKRRFHSLACAWFQTGDDAVRDGWIPEMNLKIKTPAPARESWANSWNDRAHNWLYIDALPDSPRLHIAGVAQWRGDNDVIHFGRVNGDTTPAVAHLSVSEGDCTVWAHLAGSYLVAVDNTRCGGVNVRFDGVYRKRSPLVGYVPEVRDGVTGGANIDLGQFNFTRVSLSPLSPDLKEKLKPAAGLRGEDAAVFLTGHPLHLTEEEAKSLTDMARNPLWSRLVAEFNRAKEAQVPEFAKLPEPAQTAMADLAVTFGANFGAEDRYKWGSDPELWKLLTHANWTEAEIELRGKGEQLRRNFPRRLGDRLDNDADLLGKIAR